MGFFKKHEKFIKRTAFVVVVLGVIGVFALALTNLSVVGSVKGYIVPDEELSPADCVMILGCGVRDDGTPCQLLSERLDKGIDLYKQGRAEKILMTGDHGRKNYDEVNTMKRYAMERGVPPEDIFMDHAGFSTYESMYRARDVFCVDSLIIVTQDYHLYRALYDAKALGLNVQGAAAKTVKSGQELRDVREILARGKDYIYAEIKPLPTYLGEQIPISGDGNLTNDENTDISRYE